MCVCGGWILLPFKMFKRSVLFSKTYFKLEKYMFSVVLNDVILILNEKKVWPAFTFHN